MTTSAATLGLGLLLALRTPWWDARTASWVIPLAMATTVSLAVSLGEFGASLFLVRPTTPTLPVAIYRSLSLPGTTNHAQALALATILLAACAVLGLTAQRLWAGASHKAHP
jgi:thiamine transport system permease protein